jgi:hypothetical protein
VPTRTESRRGTDGLLRFSASDCPPISPGRKRREAAPTRLAHFVERENARRALREPQTALQLERDHMPELSDTIAHALQIGIDAQRLADRLARYAAQTGDKPRAGAFHRIATALRDTGNGIALAAQQLSPGMRTRAVLAL